MKTAALINRLKMKACCVIVHIVAHRIPYNFGLCYVCFLLSLTQTQHAIKLILQFTTLEFRETLLQLSKPMNLT